MQYHTPPPRPLPQEASRAAVTKLRAAAQEDQRRSQMNLLVCYQGACHAWMLSICAVVRPLEVSSRIRRLDPGARVRSHHVLARCPLIIGGALD
jgi:hypothetical protein